jgi:hypothetical protein
MARTTKTLPPEILLASSILYDPREEGWALELKQATARFEDEGKIFELLDVCYHL